MSGWRGCPRVGRRYGFKRKRQAEWEAKRKEDRGLGVHSVFKCPTCRGWHAQKGDAAAALERYRAALARKEARREHEV